MSECCVEFHEIKETTDFILDTYGDFANSLTAREKNLIGMIQASGITEGDGRDDSLAAIRRCLEECPEMPFDVVAWRAGEMRLANRPYVSASFLKESALAYANEEESNLHKFIICKGAKVFPLRALHKDYGDGEAEIIIDTHCLKKRWNMPRIQMKSTIILISNTVTFTVIIAVMILYISA